MTTLTPDIRTLCAAIDAGDDTALLALADAMEEGGDGRMVGVRKAILCGYVPMIYSWCREGNYPTYTGFTPSPGSIVPAKVWDRLTGWRSRNGSLTACYYSRSAAFLALAEALASK